MVFRHAGGMPERSELGDFLRSRREQLKPADVGMPDNGRRRTPGLRREEVAALAGLSIDYLVRLEQGRDRNPSMGVVVALSDALRLDADERVHLKQLAACAATPDLCPTATGAVEDVAPTVRAVLDRLDPTPAAVIGPWYQLVAHNAAWERILQPIGALDDPEPNLARFLFLDPRSRTTFPDWSDTADEQVAVLRDARLRWRHDERMLHLVDELLEEPEFAVRWRSHDVARKRRGTMSIVHPDVGLLRIAYEVLLLADDTDQRLVTWLAADDATDAALRRLASASHPVAPGRLRIVGG